MAGKRSLHSYNRDTYEDYSDGINKKKVIIVVFIAIVIIAFAIVCWMNSGSNRSEYNEQLNKYEAEEKMISTYQGYDVLGKIIIEDFSVEQYILDSKDDNALDCGVTKLYGSSLNNYGNFCIAGHNKPGVFEKLSEMEVGNSFKIVEPDFTETEYKITQIYTSEPDDLKCLMQDENKIEITLITCENASTTRLIVKAEEVQK